MNFKTSVRIHNQKYIRAIQEFLKTNVNEPSDIVFIAIERHHHHHVVKNESIHKPFRITFIFLLYFLLSLCLNKFITKHCEILKQFHLFLIVMKCFLNLIVFNPVLLLGRPVDWSPIARWAFYGKELLDVFR